MATHVDGDTLRLMEGAVQKALLALAFAYEDNGRESMKQEMFRIRNDLIKTTSGRDAI